MSLFRSVSAQTPPSLYFNDDFTDLTTTQGLWYTSLLTSGLRWYPVSSGQQWGAGTGASWQSETYSGLSASFSNGTLTLSDSGSTGAFPFMWVPPTMDPFPPTTVGSFTFSAGVRFFKQQSNGWPYLQKTGPTNSYPTSGDGTSAPNAQYVNANNPWFHVLSSLVSGNARLVVNIPGFTTFYTGLTATEFHVFKVVGMVNGTNADYDLYMDGTLISGTSGHSQSLSSWPNAIWVGNPVYTFWGTGPWTQMQLDFVRVTSP